MMQMFAECKNLQTLDLSSFDTSRAGYMSDMFRGCKKLMNLDIRNFTCQKSPLSNNSFFNLFSFGRMFRECESLNNVVVSIWCFHNSNFMKDLTSDAKNLNNISVFQKGNELINFFDN